MEDKESPEARPRYVWDRDKLAWVEAAEQPIQEEARHEESIVASAYEETAEAFGAEAALVEAEAEGVEIRGVWARLFAVVIDFLVLAVFNLAFSTATGLDRSVYQYLIPGFGIAYFIGFWAWRGQTPGKMIIGAKIVRTDESPIGLWRAVRRYFGYFVYLSAIELSVVYVSWILAIILSLVIFLFVALSRDKRGLHDRLAGTIVINTRPKAMEEYAEETYEELYAEDGQSYVDAEQEPFAAEQA
jgi:uncharacterized RDD family membrane protein YckC